MDEELFWHQKSHERWLLKGDNNTDFFHKVANGRCRKNTMHSLECDSFVTEGTKNLLAHATAFYKDLFGPAPAICAALTLPCGPVRKPYLLVTMRT